MTAAAGREIPRPDAAADEPASVVAMRQLLAEAREANQGRGGRTAARRRGRTAVRPLSRFTG